MVMPYMVGVGNSHVMRQERGIQRGQDSFMSIEGGILKCDRPLGRRMDCNPNRLTVDSIPGQNDANVGMKQSHIQLLLAIRASN